MASFFGIGASGSFTGGGKALTGPREELVIP
jgi:hypothetical protein